MNFSRNFKNRKICNSLYFFQILKTIPWNEVNIRLFGIEINHVPEGKAGVKRYMEEQGFKFYKKIVIDYFFYKPELAGDMDLSFIDEENL